MIFLLALTAIMRGPQHGLGANIEPGDVFTDSDDAVSRYVELKAARPATDEDVAVAKVRGRYFDDEKPASKPASKAAAKAAEKTGDGTPLV